MNARKLTLAVGGVALLTAALLSAWQLGKRQAMQPSMQTNAQPTAGSATSASTAGGGQKAGDIDPATGKRVLYWHDPMVPGQRFEKPGKSPFMDMMLVPKYADGDGQSGGGSGVSVDPRLAQSLGMRLAPVTRERITAGVDAVATVNFNDRDVAIVQTRSGGFVERVYARAPGDVIERGAPLVDLLVPEWLGAQQEMLALKQAGDAHLADAARGRLRVLGMSEAQINEVERSSQARATVTIGSPTAGVIQELGVRAGMTLMPGVTLARINGLATVWLEAAVPEAQAAMLAPNPSVQAREVKARAVKARAVTARLAAYPGETFDGHIAAVLPETNRDTRTLRVRMEFPNRGLKLRPGMYAQVSIASASEDALVVPSEAVIRTGKRAIVFVAEPNKPGRFSPVDVELGREVDGKLIVRAGLKEGQQVVTSGQFLIDSEASLSGAVTRGAAPTAAAPAPAQAHEGTAVVTEVAPDAVTLQHGPIPSMQWGAMTMAFKFADAEQAKAVTRGDRVRFRFHQSGDDYVLERIEKLDAAAGVKK